MTASNAAQYADSLLATIRANVDAAAPFGWVHSESEEWTDERPKGWVTPDEDPDENGETECEHHSASAGDYLQDVLDIRYVVSVERKYISASIAVALGGPNAWIELDEGEVVVYWGGSVERRALPLSFIHGLDDYLGEMWEQGA